MTNPLDDTPGAQYGRSREAGVLGRLDVPMGLGVLRLSTDDRPSEANAIGLIHFALQCGIRLLDTGDSYGKDENDLHYGERLIRQALRDMPPAMATKVRITTKVGLRRRGKRWIPSGREDQIRKAVEGSLAALECDSIEFLLLHARDPQTPFEQTLATLASLQQEGLVTHLGLCNTSVAEIQQAERHFRVAFVQNELSVLHRQHAIDGLLRWTAEHAIPFLAHRPIGGYAKVHRIAKSKILKPLAERHQATPHQIALAALRDSASHVIPLIGATRGESVMSSIGSLGVTLDISDKTALALGYPFEPAETLLHAMPLTTARTAQVPTLPTDQGPSDSPEVVILMGIQGAGKSALVETYVAAGYSRLNRDELGGTLEDMSRRLIDLLASGETRVVLDNTYPTRTSRASVVAAAGHYNLPVRCRFLNTSLEEAQKNIALRMVRRYGIPLGPEEMKAFRKQDPNLPPPQALTRWANSFEPPQMDEGFGVVDIIDFQRHASDHHVHKGLLLDVDGTLRKTISGEHYPRSPEDQKLLPGRTEVLQSWVDNGFQLFFVSNQSGVATKQLTLQTMRSCFLQTAKLLNLPVTEICYCPHPAYPVGCFCRKPLPGLGVYLMERHQLALDQLVMVGDMQTDAEFASNLGCTYYDVNDFFA